MVQLFAGDDYASHMHMLRLANPKAAQALVRFAQDVSAAHGSETFEQGLPVGLTPTEEKRVDTHELVLSLLCRSRNQGVMPFLSVGLGIMAMRTGVSTRFYRLLTHLNLVHDKDWSDNFCRRVDCVLKLRFAERCNPRVRLAVFDNCSCAMPLVCRRPHCSLSWQRRSRSCHATPACRLRAFQRHLFRRRALHLTPATQST